MENVLKILSDIRVIIFIAVIIVLLLVWFLIQRGKSGSYRRQLEAYRNNLYRKEADDEQS